MGISKKINWESVFIFLFLIIFPFGQIIRMNFTLIGLTIPLTPLDIIAGLGSLYTIFFQKKEPGFFKFILYFLFVAAFSYVLSVPIFKAGAIYGLFYLFRIFAYAYFFVYVWNFAKKSEANKNLLINSLIVISVVSAIFGWYQYFTVPDLKPLYYIGWDMHLYRLAGTFLDSTFLALVIVFGLILLMNKYVDTKNHKFLPFIVFLLISLAFTYTRAAYLAFLAGFIIIGLSKKNLRKVFFWIIGLGLIAAVLPTAKNHSISLTRTFSIDARFINYKQALNVFEKYPIFGVGYNNMCVARNKFIGEEAFASHACSGSDSSLLLILATTGIVGFMVFVSGLYAVVKSLNGNYVTPVIASLVALFVHSLFSNSLFFPWIMGYMGILIAVGTRR